MKPTSIRGFFFSTVMDATLHSPNLASIVIVLGQRARSQPKLFQKEPEILTTKPGTSDSGATRATSWSVLYCERCDKTGVGHLPSRKKKTSFDSFLDRASPRQVGWCDLLSRPYPPRDPDPRARHTFFFVTESLVETVGGGKEMRKGMNRGADNFGSS